MRKPKSIRVGIIKPLRIMKKIVLICLSLVSFTGFSQTFIKTYFSGGEDLNHFNIEQTADGNYIVGGDYFNAAGTAKYYVQKVDPFGNFLWSTSIDIMSDGRLLDVAEDDMGDILLTGFQTITGNAELYIAKLDGGSGSLIMDVVVDNFVNSVGTNIIYSQATDSYIVGGFRSSNFSWPLVNNSGLLLEFDKSLNLIWSNNVVGLNDQLSSINDIVEVPNGYFVTGSIAFGGGFIQGVMAVFVDHAGNMTNNLSFEATNSRHTGVSAFYDQNTDEIYLASNSSFYHNPLITQIAGVSSGTI